MTSPPAKRQRTEDASITRSSIWYKDGSVVLQAHNTQFRVHWGLLSQHSTFFRDLEDLPQPPEQPAVDGCPVIELPDDEVDVEHLLKALYDPMFLLQKALPFPVIVAFLRLGRKYEFRDFFNTALERLTSENPTTLKAYDALRVDGKYDPTCIVPYPGVLYDILTLAREQKILSVLPCAYYRALTKHSRLFDGIPRGDGTVASLDFVDQRRCTLSRETILKKQFMPGYTLGWLQNWEFDEDDCAKPSKCASKRVQGQERYLLALNVRALAPDHHISGLCSGCKRHREESNQAGRQKMWEALPAMFNLLPMGRVEE
ncbi:hypothetical protein B0H16DRAFT_1297340 [Mycena metata]|uniref:BTB domain-containing protein n=1 Tax=Mycena metata TaxID=1033252 RepID=A0AAD7P0G7_9AGAR|nr:hypothetical protein B0H16DRAFT_1297340 [Mycena metata]